MFSAPREGQTHYNNMISKISFLTTALQRVTIPCSPLVYFFLKTFTLKYGLSKALTLRNLAAQMNLNGCF